MVTNVLIPIEDLLFEDEIKEFLVQLNTLLFRLKILHVLDKNEAVMSWSSSEYITEGEALVRTFGEHLKDYFPGIQVETAVRDGVVKEVIANEAGAFSADLILMGTHGRQGIGNFLLGSTAKEVITLAPCSVVILRSKKSHSFDKTQKVAGANQSTGN